MEYELNCQYICSYLLYAYIIVQRKVMRLVWLNCYHRFLYANLKVLYNRNDSLYGAILASAYHIASYECTINIHMIKDAYNGSC